MDDGSEEIWLILLRLGFLIYSQSRLSLIETRVQGIFSRDGIGYGVIRLEIFLSKNFGLLSCLNDLEITQWHDFGFFYLFLQSLLFGGLRDKVDAMFLLLLENLVKID